MRKVTAAYLDKLTTEDENIRYKTFLILATNQRVISKTAQKLGYVSYVGLRLRKWQG
jgi:hypothetical protein